MLGLLFTTAVGVLTFGLHQRLPYRRLLIITGAMLVVVLLVMVGEEVNEMQLAGWIGTTPIPVCTSPAGPAPGSRCSATSRRSPPRSSRSAVVVGSYLLAQYVRVWRPRRRD